MNELGPAAGRDWNPNSYLQFGGARLRPALDLLARVPLGETTRRVVDLGCGPGNVTPFLRRRFPQAEILGVDRSATMLERARAATGETERTRWLEADITTWVDDQEPGSVQLIYSNAALHWLEDHERIFPALMNLLEADGVLAVQMPQSWQQPSHRAMRDAVDALLDSGAPPEAAAHALRTWRQHNRHPNVAEAERYHRLLSPLGKQLDAWSTEILHLLPATVPLADSEDPRHEVHGRSPVLDWVFSTALRPVLEALAEAPDILVELLRNYDRRLHRAYPALGTGEALLPFRRLYLVAQRS